MLEGDVIGPLYKVKLTRNDPEGVMDNLKHFVTGPSPISVSKINQIVSLYVSILWLFLIYYSLPEYLPGGEINWFYVSFIAFSAFTCILFFWLGRTYGGGYWHKAKIRTSVIKNG